MIEKLKNFPFILVFVAYAGYVAFEIYNFHNGSDGAVEMHKTQIAASQTDLQSLKKKLLEGQKFLKTLDAKKAEINTQVKKLSEYQGALSEAPDIASLIKVLVTEAKKIELKVDKIEPGKRTQKEYYLEQEFRIEVRGTYVQVILFAERVAQLQRILRIESYALKPSANATVRSGLLQGQLSIRAYQYTPGKEDRIGQKGKS